MMDFKDTWQFFIVTGIFGIVGIIFPIFAKGPDRA